jgi:hypothetical protein
MGATSLHFGYFVLLDTTLLFFFLIDTLLGSGQRRVLEKAQFRSIDVARSSFSSKARVIRPVLALCDRGTGTGDETQ